MIPGALLLLAGLSAAPAVDPAALRAHILALSDDRMEGRFPGTAGHERAEEYVVQAFAAAGLEPAGEGGTWRQAVPLRKATGVPGAGRVTLLAAGRERALGPEEAQVRPHVARTRATVRAPVVYVGWGIRAPDQGIDSYAGVDARGAIVAMLVGAPARLPSDLRAVHSDLDRKLAEAGRQGAAGVLLLWTPRSAWFPYDVLSRWLRRGRYAWRDDDVPFGFPEGIAAVAGLSPRGTRRLFRAAGRPAPPEDAGPSFALGFEMEIDAASRHADLVSHNVAGLLPGSDPALRGETVVVLAHLDHLGIGPPAAGDRIYNGTLDNASGVAVLIEVARALAREGPPRRSVLFLAVTAEEVGLLGSDLFAERPTVPRESIVAAVNLDMVLMLEPLRAVVSYGAEHSTLGAVVERAAAAEGLAVVPDPSPEEAVYVRSDHWSLAQRGVPAIFLEVAGSRRARRWLKHTYHRPSDDPGQRLDLGAGADFARLHARIVREVADADERPSWLPGDVFGAMFGSR